MPTTLCRLLVVLLLLPALSACESTKGWADNFDWFSGSDTTATEQKSQPAEKTAEKVTVKSPAGCPPVSVPSVVAEQSLGGKAPLDLRALVHIAITSSNCEAKDGAIRQTIMLKLDATKGPALKQDLIDVPFFAAVTGASGAVLAKKMYQTTFDFSGELTDTEELAIIFTLSSSQAESATIVAGLGLDPSELPVTR